MHYIRRKTDHVLVVILDEESPSESGVDGVNDDEGR